MPGNGEIQCDCRKASDGGDIPAPRFHDAEQHVLEMASGILTGSPRISYLMSFIVRMRYVHETDSCQVVIQPHYRLAGEEGGSGAEILSPLSHEIRAALGEKISAKACGYISASSSLDEDNLTDLFILYFFVTGDRIGGPRAPFVSGVYQMNLTLRTFVPEMEDIAVDALERCLALLKA
ncbi:MAG TPA: hypothetical protein VMT31_03935 [Methanomicrobiales archaeon]|nr:hypothetical protein [Methanomicrobiales archaeon]